MADADPEMKTVVDLPLNLKRLSRDEVTWLAAKSSQTGKPVNEVARDLIHKAAERDGFCKPNREGKP